MACLEFQVQRETWDPLEPQDLLEDQEAQEDLVLADLKVNLDSQAEMVHPEVLVLKVTEVTLASRDPQESPCHKRPQRDPKEILDYQVHQVFQVRKASPVSPATPEFQELMDALDSLDPQVLREILVSQEAQVLLEDPELKALWEKWDFQDHQG